MNIFFIKKLNSLCKNTSSCVLVFLTFSFINPALHAATLAATSNYESGSLSGLACSGNCPKVATTPVSSGKYSGNYDLTRSMKIPYRTEAVLAKGGDFAFYKEYWFSFKFRFENWAKDSSSEIAPFQLHEKTNNWTTSCGYGSAVGAAPFVMVTQSDEIKFITYKRLFTWKAPIQKNKWLTFTAHFKLSGGSDGYIEAWMNGVKIASLKGQNANIVDKCGKPMLAPYLKFGVYKWDWKAGRPATQSTRRQLFIDDLKVAEGSSGLSMVTSTSSLTSTASDTSLTSTNLSDPQDNALIAHWPMSAGTGSTTIQDESGNGNTATLVNGAQSTADGSVKFDGVNDYINAGKPKISGKDLTISGWIWADDFNQCEKLACTIVSKATGPAVQDHDILLGTVKKGSKTRLRFRINADGATSTLTAKTGDVGEKSWIHVAAVFTGKRMRLYQNGVLVGSKAHNGSATLRNKNPVTIGGNSYDAAFNPWFGKISDVRFYNYALTEKEIAELAK